MLNIIRLHRLIFSLSFVILLLVGSAFYLKSKINADDLRVVVLSEIQKKFPQAIIKLGKIQIHMGRRIKIVANSFSMSVLKKQKKVSLVSVKNIILDVSIWSFLFGKGNIEISSKGPRFFYVKIGNQTNWDFAIGKRAEGEPSSSKQIDKVQKENARVETIEPTIKTRGTDDPEENKLAISTFLLRSNINLKFSDVLVNYHLSKDQKGSLNIDRFFINRIDFNSPTAYEVLSKVSLTLDKGKVLQFNFLLIGDFLLSEFFNKGAVQSNAHLKISNISFRPILRSFPNIKSDLNLIYTNKGKIMGDAHAILDKGHAKISFIFNGGKIDFPKVDIHLPVNKFLNMFDKKYLAISKSPTLFKVWGKAFSKKNEIVPELEWSLDPWVNIKSAEIDLKMKAKGSFKYNKLKIESNILLWDGSVESVLTANIDLNSKDKIKSYELIMKVNDIVLPFKKWQKRLYSGSKTKKDKKVEDKGKVEGGGGDERKVDAAFLTSELKNKKENNLWKIIPKGQIRMDLEGELAGKIIVKTSSNIVEIKNSELRYKKGSVRIQQKVTRRRGKLKNSFRFDLRRFDIGLLNNLFPPNVVSIRGVSHGSFYGDIIMEGDDLKYNINLKVGAKDGQIKGLDLKKYVKRSVNFFKDLEKQILLNKKNGIDFNRKIKVSTYFKEFLINANITNDKYKVVKVIFISKDKRLKIKASKGMIYTKDIKSKIFVDLAESRKISPFMKSNFEQEYFPMLWVGRGLNIYPKLSFSIEKLAKLRLKLEKNKIVKKVKKKVEKEVETLLKKSGRNLLKKLFK